MISAGINAGGELPADFYSAYRQTSLYRHRSRKNSMVSYAKNGRRFVDGRPTSKSTPEELWNRLMLNAITQQTEERMIYLTVDYAGPRRTSFTSTQTTLVQKREALIRPKSAANRRCSISEESVIKAVEMQQANNNVTMISSTG